MIYIYIDTKDYDYTKIDNALEYAKKEGLEDFRFLVNDIRSIDYLREKEIKAVNLDGFEDVFNIVTHDDKLYYNTEEDDTFIKIQFPNAVKF
jgi:phosphatidylserine/phosphatidylglycerophosphate/cardiolipin synthase-like enzyme